jgi:alkylation response protein AidB-like acyl-CoA dehydrogenase
LHIWRGIDSDKGLKIVKEEKGMDFRFSDEQEAFRKEFTSWLNETVDEVNKSYSPRFAQNPETWEAEGRDFQRRLYDAGYSGRHYPKEYGGPGGSLEEEMIILETLEAICPKNRMPFFTTMGLIAPTFLACGTEEQKKTFLPRMLDGTQIWCQGFSEPNAGSDVVNISTRAVKKGDHYVVNGQKVWSSYAHMANYAVVVVRTDPNVPKHKGLSYLIMDMKSAGIEVRPIVQINSDQNFCEIFLEDVEVPCNMIIGKEGDGWKIALATMAFERAMGDVAKASFHSKLLEQMLERARSLKRSGRLLINDLCVRQQLAQSWIEVTVLKSHGYRNFTNLVQSGIPGPESSIGKLLWSEMYQRLTEADMQLQGPFSQVMRGSPWVIDDGYGQQVFLHSKGSTIAAGTSEIQRNIIAERILGLPKDATRVKRD